MGPGNVGAACCTLFVLVGRELFSIDDSIIL